MLIYHGLTVPLFNISVDPNQHLQEILQSGYLKAKCQRFDTHRTLFHKQDHPDLRSWIFFKFTPFFLVEGIKFMKEQSSSKLRATTWNANYQPLVLFFDLDEIKEHCDVRFQQEDDGTIDSIVSHLPSFTCYTDILVHAQVPLTLLKGIWRIGPNKELCPVTLPIQVGG